MNISMVLDMAADGMGERRAIGNVTYAEVRHRARGVAGRLQNAAEQNRALATLSPNGTYLPVAMFGAAYAGVSYAPLNFRLPETARAELLERLQPAEVFDERWLEEASEYELQPVDDSSLPAVLLFTSGTSAAPKAAVLHHENLSAYIFNTLEFGSAPESDATLLAVPPFHIAGVAAVLSSTYVGRRLVPMARFDAEEWLRLANEEKITHAFVVPTMLARIVTVLETDPSLQPPALRSLAYGGARMPLPLLERALELFPDVGFVNAYGLTETASTVSVLGPADHRDAFESDDPLLRRRLESCGRPVPGVEFRIVDGELWIRGSQVGGGYVGSDSLVDADGWLHTGDQATIDDEGYVFIAGRGDDMIIRGGENISPSEVEDVILRHPNVSAIAVVGIPDIEWGEKLAAMIVLEISPVDAESELDEIRAWAHAQLGGIKTPEILVAAEDLPTTPTGKILRRIVKEQIAAR